MRKKSREFHFSISHSISFLGCWLRDAVLQLAVPADTDGGQRRLLVSDGAQVRLRVHTGIHIHAGSHRVVSMGAATSEKSHTLTFNNKLVTSLRLIKLQLHRA